MSSRRISGSDICYLAEPLDQGQSKRINPNLFLPSELMGHCISMLSIDDMLKTSLVSQAWRQTTVSGAMVASKPTVAFCGRFKWLVNERLESPEMDCRSLSEVQQRINELKYAVIPELSQWSQKELASFNLPTLFGFENIVQLIKERREVFSESKFQKLQELSLWLQNDKEVAMAALKRSVLFNACYVGKKLMSNKVFVLTAIQCCASFEGVLEYASEELRGDREVVLTAVQKNALELRYASPALQGDKEIVMAGVRQYGRVLQYASKELMGDREIVLVAVRQTGIVLVYVSEELRDDKEIVIAAVRRDGLAFEHASIALQGDKEIALIAVRQAGIVLKHASEELRGDREVVLAAIQSGRRVLQYASIALRDDREIVLAAIGQAREWDPYDPQLEYASEALQGDRDIVMTAMQLKPFFRNNKRLAIIIVSQNGLLLDCFSQRLQDDEEVVSKAYLQNPEALRYASPALQLQLYRT